jgi:hypothetical protein
MKNENLVSVVIPTFNRKKMLIECIDSVLESTYKNFEIIVSDDASTDGTDKAIEKYKNLKNFKYLRNKKESLLSVTVDNAILLSKGSYIFILADDNVVDKGCIHKLTESFKECKDVGIVGPIAFYFSRPDIIMHAGANKTLFMRRYKFIYMNEKWKCQIKHNQEVDSYTNAFMFRRDIAKKTGLWDLTVPFIGEDENFECRVRRLGYKIIINPDAKVYHKRDISSSTGWENRVNKMRMYNIMRNKIINEYRYDSLLGRITFTISLPVYVAFYLNIIFEENRYSKQGKLSICKSLASGIFDGFVYAILNKSNIKFLND